VLGTFGVERHAITFHGQAAHSGSTPMNRRKDAFLAAAKMAQEIYHIAERSYVSPTSEVQSLKSEGGAATTTSDFRPETLDLPGGVCTIGSCTTKPGIVTSVVEECRITLDQRHLDAAALARMLKDARDASDRFAKDGNVRVSWERLWQIAPRPFNDNLIALCGEAIRETCGQSHRLPSGPLHDAAEVAAAGVPTVMMFVQSLHGISHNKIEDTKEEHLELCVTAFDKLAEKAMKWIQKKS
jgi:N-carbamoyl-L-amino-acid hydrolase